MGKKIIVAGGGAAGMCAAIYAARNGADVTIIEKNTQLGKKLSMTGNGRCNLSNLNMNEKMYNLSAEKRMKQWLSVYGVLDVINFFKSLGIVIKSEDGYLYPVSGQAGTVVTAFENEIRRLGVKVIYGEQVKSVKISGSEPDDKALDARQIEAVLTRGAKIDNKLEKYTVVTNLNSYEADRVILATGSLSGAKSTMSTGDGYYICKQLGMNIKDTYPALVGFKCDQNEQMPENGVRCTAEISFMLGTEALAVEYGELQFTRDGISGIPVMQASSKIVKFLAEGKPIYASINFFPDYDDEDFLSLEKEMLRLRDDRSLKEFLNGFYNSNINDMIVSRMKMSASMKMKNISESMVLSIFNAYRNYRIKLSESYGYQQAQVTSGGVSLGDIKDDMAVNDHHGIFVIGELLDVDGRCGGYNLQWAFTSGSIAGTVASL
ncbi:FAD dependent oxidoreductase [Butyrivibrio proteoclasticus B316]|uniref:FAD dependent oxidoreductase n=1 Tax=Butyrivibrio proteoclasticus (strain ATCC 51982 / DSM 14932 / B316) TaxID=515622 RepID=E0RUL0_BUTPB|nr:aminoacetone oxidase family FAD-binding enzyme [Butyrivibrio proteoclasticus]ADL34051.1 FAD dependent oxidoreductase [Butyrivibrio proteoclasticus B316]